MYRGTMVDELYTNIQVEEETQIGVGGWGQTLPETKYKCQHTC